MDNFKNNHAAQFQNHQLNDGGRSNSNTLRFGQKQKTPNNSNNMNTFLANQSTQGSQSVNKPSRSGNGLMGVNIN